MKRGDKVKVNCDIRKPGHALWGNDEYSGCITLNPGDILYHSSDTKLKGFAEGWTCFFLNKYVPGHVYAMKITKKIKVHSYNCGEEARIDLDERFHELTYIGKVTLNYDYEKKGRIGNPYIEVKDNTLKEWRK